MVQVPRASRVQIELHDYEMDNNNNKGKFDMLKFSQLKTPMDWGNGNAKKAQSMMQVREIIVLWYYRLILQVETHIAYLFFHFEWPLPLRTTAIAQWHSGHLANPFTRRYDGILDVRAKKEMKKIILHSFSTVQKAMGQRHTSKITLRLQEIGLDAVNNHVSGRCYTGTTLSLHSNLY